MRHDPTPTFKPASKGMIRRTLPWLGILLAGVPGAWSQPTTAQADKAASTAPAPADPQRLEDFITLIEGPNLPAQARRTAARELLRQGWRETPARLAGILAGNNQPARVAVAGALADLPEYLDPAYVEPLMAMLAGKEPDVRSAAALALAGYRDQGVIPRLRDVMLDPRQPLERRLAAIETLGMMSERPAAAALVEALADPRSPVAAPALAALERNTAMSFGGDPAQAQAWWQRWRDTPREEWQREQIERLVRKTRTLSRRLRELEARLVESYRADYIRTPEGERGVLIRRFLQDDSALVRLLGLELVQRHLGEGKALPPEAADEINTLVRALLEDNDGQVRLAAVQTVARFRSAEDTGRFVALLNREHQLEVRRALVNGLGYIGGPEAVEPLLEILQGNDPLCLDEAVGALGRLAERGVLDEANRGRVADALVRLWPETEKSAVRLREQVLWAMRQVGDPRFGDAFVSALSEQEAPIVRQAAARGIAALKHPQAIAALIPVTRDTDLTVRKTAVEALAESASTDEHLAALWERLAPAQEPDESIRHIAWRACLRLLSGRSVAEVEQWLAKLPEDGDEQARRTRELLETMEASLAKVPEAMAQLGRLWLDLARRRAANDQPEAALQAYVAAVRDLHAGRAPETAPAAVEALRYALRTGRYDASTPAALAGGNPPLEPSAVWAGFKAEIEPLLNRDHAARAEKMLATIQAHPPLPFPEEVQREIEALATRARELQQPPSSAPTTHPTTQASQPAP